MGSAYIDITIFEFSNGIWSGGSGSLGVPNTDDRDKVLIVCDGASTLNNDATLASITIELGASLSIAATIAVTVSNELVLHDIESLILKFDASGSVKSKRFLHQNRN